MGAPIQRLCQRETHLPFRVEGVAMLMLAALPAVAAADDADKVVAAPKEFIGWQVTASCPITYAQKTSSTWCEVYGSSGQEVGTIYIYLINIPRQEDRLRAMQDCANQNPRKDNRDRRIVTLTGRITVQS
ncbi:hypothetical protein [Microvirga aerophila]|uniref:Uncharacterized protein n=1 Tax=Microvirga aerophila TaxID=670291 RepID=A0A512C4T6_9HYPH|nr:hypothetical protein [Microvirga aerophila]GEO19067.1 hypothetical protein MAE02_67630 [Microvirga aerophila]